ncbi:hypothetical protein, partial [Alienimonas sp. DA493]|uniref:hypothetical protein n=1 Tax=Alienimonas sp. DA493 TaxID=3373605 RepID=UPI0037550521
MNLALDPAVARKLDAYRRRRGRLTAFRALCAGITALLVGLAAVALIDWYWLLSDSTRWLLSAAAYGGAVLAAGLALVGRTGRLSRREQVAAAIEDADPSVRERLLSAVELAADDPESVHDSPAFRALLQGEVARLMANVRPAKLLPYRLVAGWAAAALIVIGLTAAAAATGGPRVLHLLHRAALPGANLARVSRVQVEILDPSPPSRTLPAGDTVAIVVAITGADSLGGGVSDATLETAAGDGEPRRLPLRPTSGDEWAVNLPLGEEDVTYRVLAGDAITKRYTLTVRPRPRVTAFGKTVAFPDYAALPPQTVTEEHGDLFALAGSTVELTLEPDQPVDKAELRLAPADPDAPEQTLPLTSAEGDDGVVRWSATLPMEAPGTYRVHLVSAETGFDNPFAPRSEIRPLADAPPTVAFTQLPENAAAGLLLPPDDLLDLAARAADDLPLDRVEQWVSINGGEWTATPLAFEPATDAAANAAAVRGPIDAGGRELTAEWRWDLLPLELTTGDEVRTKLVATDRKGQTGQSAVLRVLIAGEDFDPLRHAAAERTLLLVDQVAAFAAAVKEQRDLAEAAMERQKQAGTAQTDEARAARAEEYAVIQDLRGRRRDAAAALTATIAAALPGQTAGADALEWELLGRFVSRIGLEPAADPLVQQELGESPDQIRDAINRDFKEADEQAVYAEKFARRFATHGFLAAVAADLAAVYRQQDRVANLEEISWDRLARQEAVVAGRLEAIEEFARRHRDRVDDKRQREVDGLIKATDELRAKLDDAAARGETDADDDGRPSEEALRKFRETARSVRDDLGWRKKPNSLHNLPNELRSAWKYLWEHTGDLPDEFEKAADVRAKIERATEKRAAAEDSAEADRLAEEVARLAADKHAALAPDIARLRDVRTLQKARPDADTTFAADAGLAARAVDVVAEAAAAGTLIDLKPIEDEATEEPAADGEPAPAEPAGPTAVSPSYALEEIAPAFRTLQSGHELTAARRAAETLRERERWGAQTPDGLFDHPRQWDAHEAQLEYALDRLRKAKALGEGNVIERGINEARWSPAAHRAEPLITERRWKDAGPVAADAELAVLAADLRAVEAQLAPTMAEARAVLAKYAPTIPELARDAAEAARQREEAAAEATEAAENDQTEPAAVREAVRELAREQAAAERDLAELAEAFADDADRQDLRDAEQRNRAKDADAAVAAVQERAEAAERALADAARAAADESAAPEERAEPLAEAAEQQAATAEALEKVAEHFENLDAEAPPEEIAASREALRELIEEEAAAELAERFAPSEALAEAAAGDPQALLAQLEAELAVNPAMREALSDIAADAAADAQNALEESVEQEQSIQRDLDRSDEDFQQQKEAVAEDLRELAQAADRLSNRAANTARQAAERGRAEKAEENLNEAREALAEAKAATQSATADSPLPQLAEAAQQADEALDRAARALAAAREQSAAEKGNEEIHKDDRDRNRRREEMERDRQRLREAQERDARSEQKRAEDAERRAEDARRRAEDAFRKAEREANDATNQAQRARDEAQKNPDDAGRARRAEQAAAKAEQARENVAQKEAEKQAAEQARDAAKAEVEAAKRATEEVRKQPNPRLDAPNPAAELAEQLAGEAERDAKALQEQAARIAAAADFNNELDASEPALAQAEQRQRGVTERVAAAAADLERAARHEERLGQPQNAEPLANAARAVQDLAEGESTAAERQLADAAAQAQAAEQAASGEPAAPNAGEQPAGEPDPQADVAAREAVGEAEAALANEAQALAETVKTLTGEGELPGEGQTPPAGQAPPAGQTPAGAEVAAAGEPAAEAPAGSPQAGSPQSGSQPPPRPRLTPEEQARGRDLARQLDAIDRAMNAPPAPAPMGEAGEGEAVPTPADAAAELFAAAAAAESAAVSAARAAQAAPPAPGLPTTPGEPASGAAEGRGVAEGSGGAGG